MAWFGLCRLSAVVKHDDVNYRARLKLPARLLPKSLVKMHVRVFDDGMLLILCSAFFLWDKLLKTFFVENLKIALKLSHASLVVFACCSHKS